jgi:general secretion pathway protein A
MYKHFFGLSENPFNVNPDPRYLFLTPQTQEALDELTYGIQARKGLMLLTGEVGTGKTTIINRLLDCLRQQQTPTAFIFNSHLEISHLFDFILADFGVPFDATLNGNALMSLNQWLFERYRAEDTPVLIVDEAQGLPTRILEEIGLLLNLETPREKLLQIVLAGQPELAERIERPELRQIKQRIALRCKTAPLTLGEAHDYIEARLQIAGANGKPVFASQAVDAVHFYSRGIPRVMNLLCEHALINAYVDHVQPVPVHIIAEVAREFHFDDIKPVAPFIDSRNSADSNSTAAHRKFVKASLSPPAKAAPSLGEHADPLKALPSAPFIVADSVLSSVEEPVTPVLNLEMISDRKGGAGTSGLLGVQVTVSSVPGPRQMAANRSSEFTAFLSDVASHSGSGLARTLAPLAPSHPLSEVNVNGRFHLLPASSHCQVSNPQKPSRPPTKIDATRSGPLLSSLMKIIALRHFLVRWSRTWRDPFVATFASPARSHRTAILLIQLKRSLQPARARYRRCLAWRNRCLTIAGSIKWRRVEATVYRWLRQPCNPTQWRLPDSLLFEARRRFIHKNV